MIDHYEIEDELGGDEAYLDDFFSGTIEQILDVIDGTLIYKDITAHSDREICIWKASYAGQNIIKGKLIIAGHKYYGLQAFGLANKETEDSMQRFIESFHLLTEDKK